MRLSRLTRTGSLCTAEDVINSGGYLLQRRPVREVRMAVAALRPSFYGPSGYASAGGDSSPSHRATVRAMPDLDIGNTAWVLEKRRISQDIWYKVIGVREVPARHNTRDGEWVELDLQLVNKIEPDTQGYKDQEFGL